MIRRLVPVASLLAALSVLSACEADAPLTPPPAQRSVSATVDERGSVRLGEAEFAAMSRVVRGFAGFYFDENGDLVTLLADEHEAPIAEQLLTTRLQDFNRRLPKGKAFGRFRMRKVNFTFLELAAWRDALSESLPDASGIVFVDLDEVRNQITFGIERNEARGSVV